MLEALERKLSYEDLRFYRSIARSQLRKDMATRRKLEEERKRQQPQKQTSWSSWIWGSSGESSGGSGGPSADDGGAQLCKKTKFSTRKALSVIASPRGSPHDETETRDGYSPCARLGP